MSSSWKVVAVVAALAGLSASAQAEQFVIDFAAAGFIEPFNSDPAPTDPLVGSITFSAAYLGAPTITSVDAINLTIAGYTYSLSEVGAIASAPSPYAYMTFGAEVNGIDSVGAGTNDFFIAFGGFSNSTFNTISVSYATASSPTDLWLADNEGDGYASFTLAPVSSVPEPDSPVLAMTGLAALFGLQRRLKPRASAQS